MPRRLDQWAYLDHVKYDFIRPVNSTDNVLIETLCGHFNGKLLNQAVLNLTIIPHDTKSDDSEGSEYVLYFIVRVFYLIQRIL